jgi:hypothetical protein
MESEPSAWGGGERGFGLRAVLREAPGGCSRDAGKERSQEQEERPAGRRRKQLRGRADTHFDLDKVWETVLTSLHCSDVCVLVAYVGQVRGWEGLRQRNFSLLSGVWTHVDLSSVTNTSTLDSRSE